MTGEQRPGGPPLTVAEVLSETHWDVGSNSVTDLCEQSVEGHPAALRSVAHYTQGAVDFVVRPRGSAPLPSPRGGQHDPVIVEGRPGRHLVVCTEDLNRSLERFGTGELMRVVIGTAGGGMYCARVRAGQYLTGVTRSGETVDELDRTLNEVVRRIRTEVHHLPDENLGGDLDGDPRTLEAADTLRFVMTADIEGDTDEDELRRVWHRFVNPGDLQYAALYRRWSLRCAGDAFEDPSLYVRLLGVPGDTRRAMYRDLAAGLRADIARLRHALRPVTEAPIERLVLDVQEGAVYIHWLGQDPGTFLLGVTVEQPRVAEAESRLRDLGTALLTRSDLL